MKTVKINFEVGCVRWAGILIAWIFILSLGCARAGFGTARTGPAGNGDLPREGAGNGGFQGGQLALATSESSPEGPGAPEIQEGKAAPETPASGAQSGGKARSPEEVLPEIDRAVKSGLNWLITKQNPDGGYGPSLGIPGTSDVGLTAFVLYSLARSPRAYKEHDGPYISKAAEFLLSRQQPDGAFYDPKDPSLQNYKTSVAILVLKELDSVKYKPAIMKAVKFVKSQQFAETRGYERGKHLGYGGIGYGSDHGRPDLSNSQFAAEALREAGVSGADEVWVRLQVFLSRCQNAETVDPLLQAAGVGTSKDGGLRYGPNSTRGNEESIDGMRIFSSYGSMTYAGLKSMLYAYLTKDDPRVQAAFRWIQNNFTVTENPGMATPADPQRGQQGLFYYYHTMAKTLSAYGEPVIVDGRGIKHVWAAELGDQLISLQRPGGFWDNPAERWLEGIEILDTAYAIIALSICKEELEKFLEDQPKGQAPSGASGERK